MKKYNLYILFIYRIFIFYFNYYFNYYFQHEILIIIDIKYINNIRYQILSFI